MTEPGSVAGDERLRLFLALRLPHDVLSEVECWQREQLRNVRVVPREHLHVTLAFLGHRPSGELDAIVDALRAAAADAGEIRLAAVRYRETRSVGISCWKTTETGQGCSPETSRSGSSGSVSTAVSAVPGCRISRSRAGASVRGCVLSRRPGEHSFRPTLLLSYPGYTPAGRATQSWNLSH